MNESLIKIGPKPIERKHLESDASKLRAWSWLGEIEWMPRENWSQASSTKKEQALKKVAWIQSVQKG